MSREPRCDTVDARFVFSLDFTAFPLLRDKNGSAVVCSHEHFGHVCESERAITLSSENESRLLDVARFTLDADCLQSIKLGVNRNDLGQLRICGGEGVRGG